MTTKTKNIAASVHARLLNLSHKQGTDFNRLLIRFVIERILYRLSKSPHAKRFVLKGAMLFVLWTDVPYRDTQDLDLLGFGDSSPEGMCETFREICNLPVEPDGLTFDAASVTSESIRDMDEYVGSRIKIKAYLGNAEIPLQIDIGIGDALVPAAEESQYPSLLDFPSPTLKTYRVESVVAEKFQAMVSLGLRNTRMKDYFDLYVISRQFSLKKEILASAINATFTRRNTTVPSKPPLGLTAEFHDNPEKQTQWNAFVRRLHLKAPPLADVVKQIALFLAPVLDPAAEVHSWTPPGPWQ